jgi:hypothetical protein
MFDPAHAAVAIRAQRFVFWDHIDAAALLPHGRVEVDDRRAVVVTGDVELVRRADSMAVVVETAAWRVKDQSRWRGVADHLQATQSNVSGHDDTQKGGLAFNGV